MALLLAYINSKKIFGYSINKRELCIKMVKMEKKKTSRPNILQKKSHSVATINWKKTKQTNANKRLVGDFEGKKCLAIMTIVCKTRRKRGGKFCFLKIKKWSMNYLFFL
ncbi:unnamed protein product [Meloidogyne enterolobii]|uniref:Uncharacterized protein n=2 Tax=Meloidogyne enterolobii TaxID=390850 RepID=A0ACB0XLE9_MELEN|nr:unnamed protein product [Meloidogyne enterolobii]